MRWELHLYFHYVKINWITAIAERYNCYNYMLHQPNHTIYTLLSKVCLRSLACNAPIDMHAHAHKHTIISSLPHGWVAGRCVTAVCAAIKKYAWRRSIGMMSLRPALFMRHTEYASTIKHVLKITFLHKKKCWFQQLILFSRVTRDYYVIVVKYK